MEKGLWERILKLGHSVYGAWLNLCGDGDAGDRIVLEDGREAPRLEALDRRQIQNVFGLFELQRAVYATRYGQKIAAVPLDKHLGLPQGRHSYLLQDWGQHLAVQVPFATDSKTLSRILDFTPIGAHPGNVPSASRSRRPGSSGRSSRPRRPRRKGSVDVHGRRQGGADARRRQGTHRGRAPVQQRDAPWNQKDGVGRGGVYGGPVRAHARSGVGRPV